MSRIEVHLFGRFMLSCAECAVTGMGAAKVRELLAYLLLHHGRSHARERLASLLWPDTTTERSRKYLRQAIWRLQVALRSGAPAVDWLRVESDWIRLDLGGDIEVDALRFQTAVTDAARSGGQPLPAAVAAALEAAVQSFHGPLLEGWYQDWCLRERERLRELRLDALDLLAAHHEAAGRCATAQQWTTRLLEEDPAREGAHRRLMRLHYLAGDRTRALRQFEACVAALDEELGVAPSAETTALRDRIRTGERVAPAPAGPGDEGLGAILVHLRELESHLAGVRGHVQQRIAEVERSLAGAPQLSMRELARVPGPRRHAAKASHI